MNMQFKKILILISILTSCNTTQNPSFSLIGKWQNSNNGSTIEFLENGYFNIYIDDENISISDSRGDMGQLTYSLLPEKEGDRIIVKDKNKITFFSALIKVDRNIMTMVMFKLHKNLEHHIDEYMTYFRKDGPLIEPEKNAQNGSLYILPKGYRGLFIVCFGETDGEIKEEYDKNNNRIFRIPENGVLKIKKNVDPFRLPSRYIAFYEKGTKDSEEQLQKIPYFDSTLKDKISESNHNNTYVSIEGYNQVERNKVNEAYSCIFENNIEFFIVDSLKNILFKTKSNYLSDKGM